MYLVLHRVGYEVRENPTQTFQMSPSSIALICYFAVCPLGPTSRPRCHLLELVRTTAATAPLLINRRTIGNTYINITQIDHDIGPTYNSNQP